MTEADYTRAARAFHQQHKALLDRLLSASLSVSAAKMGKALPGPVFEDVFREHQALLLAMLEIGEGMVVDA